MTSLLASIRVVFGSFVLLGGLVIVAFSLVLRGGPATNQIHLLLVLSVVGLMVAFGAFIWFRWRAGLSFDTDGEAFYYLGFIYTLITLIATFYPLLTTQTPPSSQHVLGLFGLGLITTFVGLSGRILFLQTIVRDPVDEGHRRLEAAYLEAARQLESAAGQVKRVGLELEEAAKSSHQDIAQSMTKTTSALVEEVSRVSKTLTTMAEATSAKLVGSIAVVFETTTKGLTEFQQRLLELRLPSGNLGGQLKKRIEDLTAAQVAVSNAIGALEQRVTSLSTELGKATSTLSTTTAGLSAVAGSSREISVAFGVSQTAISELAGGATALTRALEASRTASEDLAQKTKLLSDSANDLNESASAMSSTASRFASAAQQASAPLGELNEKLGSMNAHALRLVEGLVRMQQLANNMHQDHQKTAVEYARGVELLKSHQALLEQLSRQLHEGLNASDAAIRQVHQNLVEATKFITSQVQ